MRKLRTPEEVERFKLGFVPIDHAIFASEQKWGTGRLERLVSTATLLAYQRGWSEYRRVIEDNDIEGLEAIAPKMIAALQYMDQEATAAGHQTLAPETWEAPMGDGTTLVVVRTNAEASAVIRAANIADGGSVETTLPPDIAITIRQQHEGRALIVVTMAEVARLMHLVEAKTFGSRWEGTPAPSGAQGQEGDAADIVRRGFPLPEAPDTEMPKALVELDF
jgi:hypothetical protein